MLNALSHFLADVGRSLCSTNTIRRNPNPIKGTRKTWILALQIYAQNVLWPGFRPGPCWESLQRSPTPWLDWGHCDDNELGKEKGQEGRDEKGWEVASPSKIPGSAPPHDLCAGQEPRNSQTFSFVVVTEPAQLAVTYV